MSPMLFRSFKVALLTLAMAQPAQAAVDISPNRVTVGKGGEITLKLDSTKKLVDASLLPGGPYEAWHLKQAGDQGGPFQWRQQGEQIWLVSLDMPSEPAVVFPAKPSHQVERNGLVFAAEGRAGLSIHDNQGATIGRYQTTGPALDIALAGEIGYIANGANGLTLIDLSDPAHPFWLGSHQKLGRIIKVAAEGTMAAAVNDEGVIYLIDASNRLEPTVISAYRASQPVEDLALYADWVISRAADGLHIIDFTAETPQISNEGLDFGQGVNFGGERRVYIENSLAYVADWFSGMHIYDISRPRMPVLLSSFHTPGSPKGMIVRDGVAFVPDDDHGLQIIDVSNPRQPRQISHIQTAGLGYTPKIVGDLLYLASHRGGFQVIDISDVAHPRQISEFDTDGKAWSLEVKGDTLYVADDDPGLLMFDISDPARPTPIGQFSPGGAAEEVVVRDNIAFVAFFEDGLYILDIADPRNPRLISHLRLPGNTRGLDLVGDTLYIASWLAGVHIVDVSDLKQPQILGQYDTRGAAWGVKLDGQELYVMDWWGGITVLDVSDPAQPQRAGGYHDRGRVNAIASEGNYLFVAQGSNGLQVFDINNPLNPTWTTGVEFPGQAEDIALLGSRAYLAAGDGGVAVIDIDNPFNVRWLHSIEMARDADEIEIGQNRLYVLHRHQGVSVVDIDGEQPRHQLSLRVNDMALGAQRLYLASDRGIHVYADRGDDLKLIGMTETDHAVHRLTTWHDALVASVGDQLVLFDQVDGELRQRASFPLGATVSDLAINGDQLLVSGDHTVSVFQRNGAGQLFLKARYPLLGEAGQLAPYRQTVYVSGEKTITAFNPLPGLELTTDDDQSYRFRLPPQLGVGSYNLNLSFSDGSHQLVEQAITVDMIRFSKPKLSMEEFKKIMEEKKKTDLFIHPGSSSPH